MGARKVDDERLMNALMDVFRAYGGEGASLSRLSAATGLQRASLYHRFPGGKDEMLLAVLHRVDQRFDHDVLAPLRESDEPVRRVKRVVARLREFYGGGEKSCLYDTLSLQGGSEALCAHIRSSLEGWIDAFAAIAREAGLSPGVARRRAEDALIRIQGALVVARIREDVRVFERMLTELPALLTEPRRKGSVS